ncbi:MAG: DUF169 domain-containing protein [Desulfobacterales bacterium]
MESRIAEAIGCRHAPVAIGFAGQKPEDARQFKPGKWGCVMFMLVRAAKGDTAVFDRETFGCFGGGVGLGFGNQYENFPGGESGFCYFLSVGNRQWETGQQVAESIKPYVRGGFMDNFLEGERYVASPEKVKSFIAALPIMDIKYPYVTFAPLFRIDPQGLQTPEVVVFLADMDQISALTILANYHREGNENVIFPYAAGCQTIGIYPFREARSENPRAVLGMSDISARVAVRRQLKDDVMTFAVPWQLFLEMEENVAGSFLERPEWQELMKLKGK